MNEQLEVILKQDFPKTHYATALRDFFDEELVRLQDITDIKGDVVEKGRILEGRQHAVRIIKRLMRIISIDKIQNPTSGTEWR